MKKYLISLSAIGYFFYSMLQLSIYNTLTPELLTKLHIDTTSLGLISSSYLIVLAATLLPAGYLLDKYSSRKFAIITFLFSVLSTSLIALHLSISTVIAHRAITGMANGFAFLLALRVAIFWFPKRHALATGLIIALSMSGGIAGTVLSPLLIQDFGLNIGLWLNTLIGAVLLFAVLLFFKDHDNEKNIAPPAFMSNIKNVIKNRINWLCGAYTGFLNLAVYILASLWGSYLLMHKFDYNNQLASEITSFIFVGMIIGSPIWGYLSDKFVNRRYSMFAGALLSTLFVVLITFIGGINTTWLIVLFLLLGFACSSQVLSYPVIAEHNDVDSISLATGFAGILINLIGAASQPLFGWLLTFNLTVAMGLLICAFGFAVFLVFFIKFKRLTGKFS